MNNNRVGRNRQKIDGKLDSVHGRRFTKQAFDVWNQISSGYQILKFIQRILLLTVLAMNIGRYEIRSSVQQQRRSRMMMDLRILRFEDTCTMHVKIQWRSVRRAFLFFSPLASPCDDAAWGRCKVHHPRRVKATMPVKFTKEVSSHLFKYVKTIHIKFNRKFFVTLFRRAPRRCCAVDRILTCSIVILVHQHLMVERDPQEKYFDKFKQSGSKRQIQR